MNPKENYLFIINPKAGAGLNNNLPHFIAQRAAIFHKQVEIIFTTHAGHAFEIASNASEKIYQVIAAVGGDGTINEVGRGLINKSISMAIVPMGSGNGLARYLKIPLNMLQAIDNIFTGKSISIDVIKINNHYSFNVSGVGFDAAVAHDFQHLKKRGFWGYFKMVVKQIFNFKPVEINVDIHPNDEIKNIKDKVFLMAIANSNQFGNNAIIAPAANAMDGKFNLVMVKPFSWLLMPYYAVMMFTNQFDKISAVANFESVHCTINTSTNKWHVDGEPVNLSSPIEIKILPLAIQIIVPQ
jgi:YegS/Rv2252/BmrU family lipid kinase